MTFLAPNTKTTLFLLLKRLFYMWCGYLKLYNNQGVVGEGPNTHLWDRIHHNLRFKMVTERSLLWDQLICVIFHRIFWLFSWIIRWLLADKADEKHLNFWFASDFLNLKVSRFITCDKAVFNFPNITDDPLTRKVRLSWVKQRYLPFLYEYKP